MLALGLAALLQVSAPAVAAGMPCTAPLCDAWVLRPYFAKLAAARAGGPPVHIVQIGDSHTAGDQITGSWRTLLQTQYGSAGRGVLPPGRPYAGYLTRGITASQSPGWQVNGLFGSAYHPEGPPVGLSGYSLTSTLDGANISLQADANEPFDLFTVCALQRPGAGTLTLSAGSASQAVPLNGPTDQPTCTTVFAGTRTYNASVTASGGPVTITSWATALSGHGGVILSNLGTVGAQLVHFARSDDLVVQRELQVYRPDLIVVAFGTNEAFGGDFSPASFEATLRGQIARLRRMAPGTPILLIGAPDSGTRRPELIGNAYGSAGACAGLAPQPQAAPEPGESTGEEPTAPQLEPPASTGSGWQPTRALPMIQAIQRRVAHELGLAFWDWSARMGGRCTASIWSALDPPLMRGDHVHFTTLGGAEIARRLQGDLGVASGGASAPQLASPAARPFVITPGEGS